MHESNLIVRGRGNPPMPSNLGPGPTELIGYYETPGNPERHTGFFGEASRVELITGGSLAFAIGLTAGVSQYSTDPWLKFLIDGRVVYTPKRTFRHSISWDAINACQAVYGDRTITIADNIFKVSLWKGAAADPTDTVNGSYDGVGTHGSEWNRLFYNVCTTTHATGKPSQEGDQWATYTETELCISGAAGYGYRAWCQETSLTLTNRVYRGSDAVSRLNFGGSSTTSTSVGWRPRLELIS